MTLPNGQPKKYIGECGKLVLNPAYREWKNQQNSALMVTETKIPTAVAEPVSTMADGVAVATVTPARIHKPTAGCIPVEVPEGCGPGDLIRVPLVNDELFDVTVPQGCHAGSVFQVAMPSKQQQQQQQQQPLKHQGPVLQNKTATNSAGDVLNYGEVHMNLDKTPIVAAGAEHRTIAIEMTERGCCKEGFYGNYQPNKISLSSDEFYEAIEKYEQVGCCGDKDRVTDKLNKQYNSRHLRFKIERRADMVLSLEYGTHSSDKLFLTITQN